MKGELTGKHRVNGPESSPVPSHMQLPSLIREKTLGAGHRGNWATGLLCLLLTGCAAASPPQDISAVAPAAIEAPAPDVPAADRAFSGVWTGKWDGKWDAVIIIKHLSPDGTAKIEYRWVERVGQPYAAEPDLIAQIKGGTLTSGSIRLSLDTADPSLARGEVFSSVLGRPRYGVFKKQPI